MTTVAPTKTGSLTIAGSGIASVGQLTLETLSHIQQADKVFYIVCDPATEAFIQANAKAPTSDLSVYYDTDKSRYDSYVQMAEVMLQEVRGGKDVLGVFYGHPGVFVSPSHRALAIARSEGYKAKMLPGVSAEDYMFADLEFDPAVQGCATFEATELLLRDVPLNPTMNNIIWQVGAVGVGNMIFNNAKFHLLVDRLEKDFGPEHKVVHYIGAVLPQSATVMDTFTVAELRKDDVVKQFNPSSTLFVPPLHAPPHSAEMAARLCATSSATLDRQQRFPGLRWASDGGAPAPAYGPREKAAVAQLAEHAVPKDHKVLIASAAMKKLVAELGYDAGLQAKYKADPKAFADAAEGLTDLEKTALGSGHDGAICHVMKPQPGVEITAEQLAGPMPRACFGLTVVIIILV